MSENVQIALIIGIAAVLLLALWLFKDKLNIFSFTANKKGVTTKMEQHKNTGINISGNTQAGKGNAIAAETTNVSIENNRQDGDENVIRAAARSKK